MAEQQVLDEPQTDVAELPAAKPRLELKTEIKDVGPCKKHVRVIVAKDAVAGVMAEAVQEYTGKAEIPGFRVGKVPASLIKKRFKKEISDQVKQRVLMVSLDQIAEESKIDPINQPNLDMETVNLPDDADFEYEFEVEVRPTFELPSYKGMKINRPVREVSPQDIDDYQTNFAEQYGVQEPIDAPVAAGDFVNVDIVISRSGVEYNRLSDVMVRVLPLLKFQDGELAGFDTLLIGARVDETRTAKIKVSMESPVIEMRGEVLDLAFTVLDVKRMSQQVVDEEFCTRVGFASVEALRTAIRRTLERQVKYEQRQTCRKQITEKIIESANWELPEDMVAKQVENALRREVLEMQQAGFTTQQILSRENDLRQESLTMTRRNLKEHFVLDRIATEEKLEVSELEIEQEISAMSFQRGESPRRVRARLMKSGVIENLFAQIRERKAVDLILDSAEFHDTPFKLPADRTTASLDRSVCIAPVVVAPASTAGDDDAE